MTEKQIRALHGLAKFNYLQLSASEAGDPEIQELFDAELVRDYWARGTVWCLTPKGQEEVQRLLGNEA
jgi:hypothetical protein